MTLFSPPRGERIAAIKERISALATSDWYADQTCGDDLVVRYEPKNGDDDDDPNVGRVVVAVEVTHEGAQASWEDAEFIANARQDIPWLIEQHEANEARWKTFRQAVLETDEFFQRIASALARDGETEAAAELRAVALVMFTSVADPELVSPVATEEPDPQ